MWLLESLAELVNMEELSWALDPPVLVWVESAMAGNASPRLRQMAVAMSVLRIVVLHMEA
jgi:hypothetical protein